MKRLILSLCVICCTAAIWSCSNEEQDVARIETSAGVITVKLYDDTPLHKENFKKMVAESIYDSMLFHRVINDFVIQAGDPTSKGAKAGERLGRGGAGEKVPSEITTTHFHKKGVLAAAREGNSVNPLRNSSGSHFYFARGKSYSHQELTELVEQINENRHTEFINATDSTATLVPLTLTEEQIEAYTSVGGIPRLDGEYTIFGEIIEGIEVLDKIIEMPTDNFDRPFEDVRILSITIK